MAVRWYLRFNLSYRDLEALLAERGMEVDHTTVYRWFQRFAPLLADAARPCRHAVGARWQVDELLPAAWHRTERHANNRIEADHGRLKARLRPMRGLKRGRNAKIIITGHALVQNVRRGHYGLAIDTPATRRVAIAFEELAAAT